MTERTPAPDSAPERPSPPPEGVVHRGRGPRLRRAGRTAAILAVLAFIGLLTFLTSRYSHDFQPASPDDPGAASPLRSLPLSAERIEALAKRRLEEELRAAQRPPGPPDLDLGVPGAAPPDRHSLPEAPPPPPVSPRSTAPPPRVERPALHSPLTPRGSRGPSAHAAPQGSGARIELPSLPELPGIVREGGAAPSVTLTPGSASAAGPGDLPAAPRPLDRRAFDLPDPSAHVLTRAPAPAVPTLYAGTAVPLVLTHDVATDVPGPVRAYVARDVYDSVTGRRLLIPRGSLALGHQGAHAASGDRRVLVLWRELKLPSGESYRLPLLPAGSGDATAGVRGRVDNHWGSRIGSAVALSLVGAAGQLAQPQERTSVQGFAPSEGQIAARELGLELGRLSQEVLRRGVNRPPTIHLRAGQRLTLLLTRDLAFPR